MSNRTSTRRVAIGLSLLLLVGVLATALISASRDSDQDPADDTAPTVGPLTVTVPGDLDGDNEISEEEVAEVEQTKRVAADITNTMVGPRVAAAASSIAVTPAGQDWWEFVSSQTSFSRLWEMPAPETNWYALTWTTRFGKKTKGVLDHYPAIHLAFPSMSDAAFWGSHMAEAATSLQLDFLYRGSVVTIAPAGTGLANEPLPKRLDEIKDVPQTSGYWSVDMAQQVALTAPDAERSGIYTYFWETLGLADAKWAAISRDPGRWVGTITGFDKAKADGEEAGLTLNRTMNVSTGDLNMGLLGQTMYVRDHEGAGFGPPHLEPKGGPKDPDFVYATEIGLHSITVSDGTVTGAPIGYFAHWIIDDVITVMPFAAPDRGAIDLSKPTETEGPPPGASKNPTPKPGPIPEVTPMPAAEPTEKQ